MARKKSILDSLSPEVRKKLVHDMRSANMKKYNAARRQFKIARLRMSDEEKEIFDELSYSEKRALYLHDANDSTYGNFRVDDYKDVNNLLNAVYNYDEAADVILQMQKILDYLGGGPVFDDPNGDVSIIMSDMEFVKNNASVEYLNSLLSSKYEEMDEKFYYATEKMAVNLRDVRRGRTADWWDRRVAEVKNKESYVKDQPFSFDRKKANKPKTSGKKTDKWDTIYSDMPF